jgi:hypothetical protein
MAGEETGRQAFGQLSWLLGLLVRMTPASSVRPIDYEGGGAVCWDSNSIKFNTVDP